MGENGGLSEYSMGPKHVRGPGVNDCWPKLLNHLKDPIFSQMKYENTRYDSLLSVK